MRKITRRKAERISRFIDENPNLKFTLTNHVFERLYERMGWTRREAIRHFRGREIVVSLSEGMMEIARDGAWKIHLFGLGKFVVLKNTDQQGWTAVTFYPEAL